MAVEVNSVGAGVEISWDALAESGPPEVEAPPEFPAYPDNTLPGDLPHPDQGLPGDQPSVEHPIFLPPYIDNSLPQPQPKPEHPIVLPDPPPSLIEGIDPDKLEAIKDFFLGNLPPYEGAPPYPAPTGGKVLAVQVFAQGMDGDWSNTAVQPNDGLALLRYPEGFSGESYVEVRGIDGTLVDSGVIQVG